ncbi:hypothetical protein D3C76_1211360 [compost metagenome]
MHVSLVEHHILTVTPGIHLAVDVDAAIVGVGCGQAQVIAQRAGERVAVRVQVAAAWQQGEHCALDVGDAADQLDGARAQGFGRWQRFVVPLQVEALPALLEERAEACVVVFFSRADIALVEQAHGLFADVLPVVLQHVQLRETLAVQVGFGRHTGKQVHQGVVRGKQRRMVDELAQHRQAGFAAQVHEQHAAEKHQQDARLGCKGKGHAFTPWGRARAAPPALLKIILPS